MKIQYWGTAAAEGIPALFCNCKVCQEARKEKGKYIRTRSQLMIDDALLVDYNADTYAHSLKYDYNLANVKDVLITHVHEDHYYPDDMEYRSSVYSHDVPYSTLTFHGSEDLFPNYKQRASDKARAYSEGTIAFETLETYKWQKVGDYEVAPLPATHGTPHPFVYIIRNNGKTAFILNDSGMLCSEAIEWIRQQKIVFDVVSYDCTMGDMDTLKAWGKTASHMGLPNILETRRIFTENGNYKSDTKSVLTHFSHNGTAVGYADMKSLADKHGFLLAYDGFTLEV